MSHVFISYSHKDSDYAHRLGEKLESLGLRIWIDDRIDYGYIWPEVIEKSLLGCNAFIVIMTPESEHSSWVQKEVSIALEKGKRFFPILLNGEIWQTLRNIQLVDVRNGNLPPAKFYSEIAKYVEPIPLGDYEDVCPPRQEFQLASRSKINHSRYYIRPAIPSQIIAPKTSLGMVIRSRSRLAKITTCLLMVTPNIIFSESFEQSLGTLDVFVIENNLASYGYEGFGQYEAIYVGVAELRHSVLQDWLRAVSPLITQKKLEYHPIKGEFTYSEWDLDYSEYDPEPRLPYEANDEKVKWQQFASPLTVHHAIHRDDKIILDYPEWLPILEYRLPFGNENDIKVAVNQAELYGLIYKEFSNSFASNVERLRNGFADDETFNNDDFKIIKSDNDALVKRFFSEISQKSFRQNKINTDWLLSIYGIIKRGDLLLFRGFTDEFIPMTPAYSKYLIYHTRMTADDTYFIWEISN